MTFAGPNWKPSRTARKLAEQEVKQTRKTDEIREKKKVRLRDKHCRFPLCGCGKRKIRLEVSHDVHKGMGGKRHVSTAPQMILLCYTRHQDGLISRHHGTLRTIYLTDDQDNGPIAWEADLAALERAVGVPLIAARRSPGAPATGWVEIARETSRGVIGPLESWQALTLKILGNMEA